MKKDKEQDSSKANPSLVVFLFLSILLYFVIIVTSFTNEVNASIDTFYIGNTGREDTIMNFTTLSEIDLEFGEENVTRTSGTLEFSHNFEITAVDSNFIETAVFVHDAVISDFVLQEVNLLFGETWTDESEDYVVVIDLATSREMFDKDNSVGEIITMDNHSFEVIGVVSNTIERERNVEFQKSHGEDWIEVDYFLSDVYIPFYFSGLNFETDEYNVVEPSGIIIKSTNYFAVKSDGDKALTILDYNVEGYRLHYININRLIIDNINFLGAIIEIIIVDIGLIAMYLLYKKYYRTMN